MVFNSLTFLLFFPSVALVYFVLPHRWRWVLLLLASYAFYGAWKVEYLGLIMMSTLVDYSVSRFLDQSQDELKRKLALGASIVTNLGLLFFFKYANWFVDDVLVATSLVPEGWAYQWHQHWQVLLPVGISFYTFQTLSYTIDVYFRKVKSESNLLKFGLYVSFFPQLVAGPIERFSRLHHQLFERHPWDWQRVRAGLQIMLFGFFIKMCVADNLAPIVDQVFAAPEQASSEQLFWGMFSFGLQIYSDFHGYSLIAIGTARVLGIRLIDNFNSPYFSTSIKDFWSRWHISLSTWFRDYVYIPLGGNQHRVWKWSLNILIVFAVSGLWHGANWTFVIWGCLHGLAYLVESFTGFRHMRFIGSKWLQWLMTMSVVFIAWVFFRAPTASVAANYLQRMSDGVDGSLSIDWDPMIISFVGLFLLSDVVMRHGRFNEWCDQRHFLVRWSAYAFLIYAIAGFAGTVNHPFIYFQF